jgi:hypothetical protein
MSSRTYNVNYYLLSLQNELNAQLFLKKGACSNNFYHVITEIKVFQLVVYYETF